MPWASAQSFRRWRTNDRRDTGSMDAPRRDPGNRRMPAQTVPETAAVNGPKSRIELPSGHLPDSQDSFFAAAVVPFLTAISRRAVVSASEPVVGLARFLDVAQSAERLLARRPWVGIVLLILVGTSLFIAASSDAAVEDMFRGLIYRRPKRLTAG